MPILPEVDPIRRCRNRHHARDFGQHRPAGHPGLSREVLRSEWPEFHEIWRTATCPQLALACNSIGSPADKEP